MIERRQQVVAIPIDALENHPQNASAMSADTMATLRRHIEASGRYEPVVVRPLDADRYQLINGHQRVAVLRELGAATVECVVWEPDDNDTRLLLATLNGLRGEDVPTKRAALLTALADHFPLGELTALVPEDRLAIEEAQRWLDFDLEAELARFDSLAETEIRTLPLAYSFAVDPTDGPTVDAALERAMVGLAGANRRGRALVRLAESFLEAGHDDIG